MIYGDSWRNLSGPMSEHKAILSCEECGAKCCRYIALEIDEPDSAEEYDYLRWYLMHKNVVVFIDEEDCWFLEFATPCRGLGGDHACMNYEQRPMICRDHGLTDGDDAPECEHHGEGEPHAVRFTSPDELERYLDDHDVDWRWWE